MTVWLYLQWVDGKLNSRISNFVKILVSLAFLGYGDLAYLEMFLLDRVASFERVEGDEK